MRLPGLSEGVPSTALSAAQDGSNQLAEKGLFNFDRSTLKVRALGKYTSPQLPSAASAAPDVRAYALNAASKTLIESVRGWPEVQHATPVRHMHISNDGGAQVRFSAEDLAVPALAWTLSRPRRSGDTRPPRSSPR